MLNTINIIISILILLILTPQTEQYNVVLNFFQKTGFFVDYKEVKIFLKNFSWFLIIIFLLISIF